MTVDDNGQSLLGLLRDDLGLRSVKDGCSPQGQCGCCTVLVDGKPRVACVTPARRVQGRSITTLEGLDDETRDGWAEAFCATGASQCGFCTPGIILRLEAAARSEAEAAAGAGNGESDGDSAGADTPGRRSGVVDNALLAHLCRCTGWQTITEAWWQHTRSAANDSAANDSAAEDSAAEDRAAGSTGRDLEAAARRAEIEGRSPQLVSPEVALGGGGFVADTAPADALVAVAAADGTWVVGESLADARSRAGKVQGRRTTVGHDWPLEVPPGEWVATLRTTWVEPAYLEPDAAWCDPGGEPRFGAANGGAFGAKRSTAGLGPMVANQARRLADEHRRPVLVLASREDATRLGPKRPPVAGAVAADGTGVLRYGVTPGSADLDDLAAQVAAVAPGLTIEPVEIPGPPVSGTVRAALWAEAAVLAAAAARAGAANAAATAGVAAATAGVAAATAGVMVTSPDGATAWAAIDRSSGPGHSASEQAAAPVIRVRVRCGPALDDVVLRSYCIGAAHMAWSWLTSEALTIDGDGVVHDLTVRSFGVLRAVDTPHIEVTIEADADPAGGDGPGVAVNGSDAVFAAVAAAGWLDRGRTRDWPVIDGPGRAH